jgi:hypothetical protein
LKQSLVIKGYKLFQFLSNTEGSGSFLDFIIGIKFIIDIGWAIITSLGFIFNKLGLNIVILILFIEGIGIRVFNISTLAL